MVFLFILLCLVSLTISPLVLRRIGGKGYPLVFSLLFVFSVTPLLSLIRFKNYDYDFSINMLILSYISIVLPIYLGSIFLPKRKTPYIEKSINLNKFTLIILLIALIISIFGTFKIYQIVFSTFSISSINDLNIAMTSKNLPSFGIYGRMNRLSIAFGIIAFCGFIFSKTTKEKCVYGLFLIAFTSLLIGVRRATLINQLVIYIIIFLGSINNHKVVLKNLAYSVSLVLGIIYFFGAVQIATNKADSGNALSSGFNDGLLYITGNIPYAECIDSGNYQFNSKNSFPFIYMLFESDTNNNIEKPFCDIEKGQLFNTSPMYFDIVYDQGYSFLIAFMISFGILLTLLYFGYIPVLGLQAIITCALMFAIRENQIGQYDTIFTIVIYPLVLAILIYMSRKGEKNG